MDPLFDALASLVDFFYSLVPDYAAAIALLTLTVMLVLSPLTWKGTRSMLAMQRLQPEIKRLQAKHKNDRQALNEAMMAFYKEHQVNPLAGCLPQLVQFPVLIVMFNVIRGLTHVNSEGAGDPKYLSHSSELYQALRDAGGKMVSLGMDLSKSASEGGKGAVALYILIGLVVATSFWQSRQMTARNPSAASNPQMQIMQRVFPLISGLISFSLPGGVVFYFLISNLFRIAQQSLMYRLDPALSAEVRKEVKEIDAKADEIERRHKAEGGSSKSSKPAAPKPAPTSGRVTESGSNGAQARGRPNSRRARKKRSRKR